MKRLLPPSLVVLVAVTATLSSPDVARGDRSKQPSAPVDLLHAVATDVAVSTAYRDAATQVPRLFDGDLTTAWNSRSGDLTGAWVDVRLPASVRVTSIAMTVGFTHRNARNDLFTANHRVARVRVLRDGTEVGTFDLDTSSRALQTLPVSGPGGTYRIEIAEVLAGSRRDWREVCVSELRVLGRATDAQPGARFPRYAVGALPSATSSSAAPPSAADRAAVQRTFRTRVAWFAESWGALDHPDLEDRGDPEPGTDEVMRYRNGRRQLLRRVLELVESADPARADPLRAALASDPSAQQGDDVNWLYSAAHRDLAVAASGFAAVAEWLGDDDSRCRWARAHAGLRISRLERFVRSRVYLSEASESMDFEYMEPAERRAFRQRATQLDRLAEVLSDAVGRYRANPRQAALRLGRVARPELPDVQTEWDAMTAPLTVARTSCGWE